MHPPRADGSGRRALSAAEDQRRLGHNFLEPFGLIMFEFDEHDAAIDADRRKQEENECY